MEVYGAGGRNTVRQCVLEGLHKINEYRQPHPLARRRLICCEQPREPGVRNGCQDCLDANLRTWRVRFDISVQMGKMRSKDGERKVEETDFYETHEAERDSRAKTGARQGTSIDRGEIYRIHPFEMFITGPLRRMVNMTS